MTLQSSGEIRFSQIKDEFGYSVPGTTSVSLGNYRNSDPQFSNRNVGTLTDLPLDTGVPKAGEIKASDFYSKKLNVVVDLFSQANETTRQNIKGRWNSGNVFVVGGYRGRPPSSTGTKVIANIDKIIGSEKNGQKRCAVRTGTWDANTTLDIQIASGAKLYGSGGNGGAGSTPRGSGGTGETGTSALGIEYSCTVNNLGLIQSGYGGGGGGGGRVEYRRSGKKGGRDVGSSGGGGAGGPGFPIGAAGAAGTGAFGGGSDGSAGQAGNYNPSTKRTGGAGGQNAGKGGDTSNVNNTATKADNGGEGGGTGGNNGYAIVTSLGTISLTGNPVVGRTLTNTSPD